MSESSSEDISALRIDRGKTRRRRRRSLWPRLVGLALLAGALWLFQRPLMELVNRVRLPEVEVTRLVLTSPSSATGARGAAANGYVVARTRAALSAEQPGRIVALNVVEGTEVERGDVVARLDSTEQEAGLESAEAEVAVAEAAVARAEADLEGARADLERVRRSEPAAEARLDTARADRDFAELEHTRFQELVAKGIVEERRRDEVVRDLARAAASQRGAEAELAAAEAEVSAARSRVTTAERALDEAGARKESAVANVERARAALEKTFVRAPFDGVIVQKEAEVGEVVSPNSQGGSTARGSVATMVDFGSLEVQAEVPETTLAAVRRDGPARVYLDAYPDQPYAARIDRIWPTADRTQATVEVRIAFDELDDKLRPDMGVRVVFLDDEPQDDVAEVEEPVVLVPPEAVVERGGERGVFVLERDRLRFRAIRTGEARSGRLAAESGLDGDERVVLSPAPQLEDGDRVRVEPRD